MIYAQAKQHTLRLLSFFVLLAFGGLALAPSAPVHAQEQEEEPEEVYRVETTDGNVFIGTLVSENDEAIVLQTEQVGEITLDRSDIERMTAIDLDRVRNGKYWFENPQSTRYFFSPNAIGLERQRGYYQNAWIFFNNVNYGVTDHFSLGAGTVPIFLFGAPAFPVWLLPKLSTSTPQDNLHVAAGAMVGGVLAEESVGVGLVYAASTIGSRDNNLTVGLAYGYAEDEWSETPVINVSGMTRVGRTTYLLSENYFSVEGGGLISGGIRWAPENFAVDFGLFRPLEETGDFFAAPWLGVTIPFGR